jgi:hypothetical protein
MKKSNAFFLGLLAVLLAIGLVLIGCEDEDTWEVAKPTASPTAGVVARNTEITLSTTTSGASIYYTTDGSTPDHINWNTTPYTSTKLYNTANKPKITSTTTIKAIAATNDTYFSKMLTATYTISDTSSSVYVGVATFNDTVKISDISNNLGTAKTFIDSATNTVDATALCYALSKGVTMFSKSGLPTFDNTFIVTFTDGVDNRSSSLYVADGKNVTQTQVYNQAKTDLAAKPGLESYAIGFTGREEINATQMQNLVQNGQYKTASNVTELNSVFKSIADSVLASSKNVTLKTNVGLFTDLEPKYFRLTVTAVSNLNSSYPDTYTDTIHGKLVYNMGQTGAVPVFTVTQSGTYTTFDNPINGTVSSGKILLPLNNLKYTRSGMDYFIESIKVEVSYDDDGKTYREDTEDSSVQEDIAKIIGVVLVIDCSQSLGTAFSTVKSTAKNFIDTLAVR